MSHPEFFGVAHVIFACYPAIFYLDRPILVFTSFRLSSSGVFFNYLVLAFLLFQFHHKVLSDPNYTIG